jgi:NADH-quinone oxidoreductase subunit C/D
VSALNDPFFQAVAEDVRAVASSLPFSFEERNLSETTITLHRSRLVEVCEVLKRKHGFRFLMDLCGLDWPGREERFEVVYHFFNNAKNKRLRIKVSVPEGGSVPTLTKLWHGANWLERETFDMFGIGFEGHPDLRRILTHHDFEGHPLRKDYPADKIQPMSSTPLEHVYDADRARLMQRHQDDLMWINIGPAHPVTHGTLRFMAVIDGGEVIRECDSEIGYLHRCFEKMCETHNYNQIIPYTDRLNYCSAPMNNSAYAMAVEKLLGIDIPDRAKMIRMILDEYSRIIDHIVCVGTNVVDVGAVTGFFYMYYQRERVYTLFEKLCGARLTVSLTRIGGMGFDLPEGWLEEAADVCDSIEKSIAEFDGLVTKNRILVERMKGVGSISMDDAISYGWVGPCLRATGCELDLRKTNPYYLYDQVDFDVPVGSHGDTYDRYLVRLEEMRQSVRIIRWCLKNMPSGPVKVADKCVSLPEKRDVYGNIEGLMNHFMLIINGVKPPVGEVYSQIEAANGELGFYIVSDGSGKPYRVKCRAPGFAIMSGFAPIMKGQRIADLVAALGSLNIVAGELDR